MRAFELIERLMNTEKPVCVLDSLGRPVDIRVVEMDGKIVIIPHINAVQPKNSDPLSLNAYQEYAFAEAVYPDHGKGGIDAISFVLAGLMGEVGAGMHRWLDTMRLRDLTQGTKDALVTSLAHSLWYFSALAKELNITLSELGAQSIRQAREWRRTQELMERQSILQPRDGKRAASGTD